MIKTVFFFLIFIQGFAQNQKALDAYQNRFIAPEKSTESLLQLENIAKSNQDQLLIHSLKSLIFITQKKYDEAKKSLEIAETFYHEDLSVVENGYYEYAKARLFLIYEMDDKALSSFFKSYKVFQIHKEYSMSSIVAVYISYQTKYNTYKYINHALDYAQKSKDISTIINARVSLANYMFDDYTNKKESKYNSTIFLEYLKNTVSLVKNEELVKDKYYLAVLYFNYGYNLLSITGNKTGESYMDKALGLSMKYNFMTIIRNYYGGKGNILLQNEDLQNAKIFYKNGLQVIQTMPFLDTQTEILFYRDLKKIAELQKNWQEYYQYDSKFQILNTKLQDENKQKAIQTAIAKYELQEKQEKINLLSSKNKIQFFLIVSLFLLILLVISLGFLYQKNQKLKLHLFHEQNKKLESEKNLVQKELLNSVLHIEKKNEILTDIKREFLENTPSDSHNKHDKALKIINKGLMVDDDFEKFKNNFNPIYPKFFEQLQKHSQQTLTPLDLKYCAFILIKLSNKEIASQMNVEPKSIRMARYRIKKKLNLGAEENLDDFIQSLS